MTFDFKNASASELAAEYRRIAKLTETPNLHTRNELGHLPGILAPSEPVLGFCGGSMDGGTWIIVLTDRRILFLDKGWFFGLKQVSIDLDKVNAVTGSTGILLGEIAIEDGAWNRVIRNVQKRSVVPFTNLVRDALEARKRPASTPSASSKAGSGDAIDRLERLAALRRDGVLTEDEFLAQKAKILTV